MEMEKDFILSGEPLEEQDDILNVEDLDDEIEVDDKVKSWEDPEEEDDIGNDISFYKNKWNNELDDQY